MYCPNCGATRDSNGAYCTACGEKLDAVATPRQDDRRAAVAFRPTAEIVPDGLPENISKLRHPLEWPSYVFAVILLPAVVILLASFIPEAVLLVVTSIVVFLVIREVFRRWVHGNAVMLSRQQFPDIYETVDAYSRVLGFKRSPDVFVANGNGSTNAFAVETWGKSYIVLYSELFSDQGPSARDGLNFIIGHELGHIRLKHTNLIYHITLIPWELLSYIPILGPFLGWPYNLLSRFREYSCDRIGASLSPNGVKGLILLAAGRYVYERVDLSSYLQQTRSRETMGRWTGIAELLSQHPFVSNRVRNLHDLGFWSTAESPAVSR